MHAAVIAINDAIDHGVPEGTLAAMQNPNAMLVNLDPSGINDYHHTLYRAKGEKVASSRKRVRSGPGRGQGSGSWIGEREGRKTAVAPGARGHKRSQMVPDGEVIWEGA